MPRRGPRLPLFSASPQERSLRTCWRAGLPLTARRLRRLVSYLDDYYGTLLHVLDRPVVDHLGDLKIVLLDHHHVTVAVDAFALQRHPFGLHPGLIEIFDRAVVVELVVRRLRRDHDGRDIFQVDELPWRRL